MKYKILILMLVLCNLTQAQNDTTNAIATMNEATVYYGYGAELTHQAKITVNKNTKIVIIDKLSTQLDINSVQINCPENIALLSQQYSVYYPATKSKPIIAGLKKYTDSIKVLTKSIAIIENKKDIDATVLLKTEQLIAATINTSANKTTLTADVLKLIEFYTAKIEKNKLTIFNYQQQINELNETIAAINERINKLSNTEVDEPEIASKPYGRMILQVICGKDQQADIGLSYYTTNAGWQPIYDLRVNSKTNAIKLVYKASVIQNTGINWEKTKLTLSTGTPNFSTEAPLLSAWYLQYYVPQLYNALNGKAQGLQIRGLNSIQYYKETNDIEKDEVQVETLGYATKKVSTDMIQPSTLQDFTTLKQGLLNTNFEIDLPYNIESNGLAHSINIKEKEIESNLKNYAVPKLDGDAYLLAEISNWESLDLIHVNANIIMDNTYIGKSFIDPNTTADTLNLSLGKDKRIAIKRTVVKDATTSRTKDDYIKQTFTYEIKVKNNKTTNVTMVLKDQYPMSNIKEVQIELVSSQEASINPDNNVLTWKLNLTPGEVKTYRFSYTIKYPKDKKIVNIK